MTPDHPETAAWSPDGRAGAPSTHRFDETQVGLALCSAKTGIVLAATDTFARLLSRNQADPVGCSLAELGLLDSGAAAPTEVRRHVSGQDGHGMHVLVSSLPDGVDGAGYLVAMVFEVAVRAESKAERRLIESRLAALISRARDILVLMDENLDILYASPSVYELLGVPFDTPPGDLSFSEAMTPDHYGQSVDRIRQIAATGRTRRFTNHLRAADGSLRTYDMLIDSRLDDPNIRAIVSSGRDITDLVESQQALQALDRRYSALIRQSSDILCIWDAVANCYTFASPSLFTTLGVEPLPVEHLELQPYYHPSTQTMGIDAATLCARTGEPQRSTIGLIDVHGGEHWFDVLFTDHSNDPDIGGVMVVGRDITERIAAEHALQALDSRYSAMIADSPDLHVLLGADLRPVWISASTYRFIGGSPGMPFADEVIAAVPVGEVDGLVDDLRRVATTGEVVRRELRAIDAGGHERWFDLVISNHVAEPSLGGILLIGRDITDRRRTEQAMQRLELSDPVTGLANRTRFIDRLAAALDALVPGEYAAVLLVNIDNFRRFNEALGHGAGDEALRIIADRLADEVGPGGLVARFSGDRFAVMLDRATAEDAERMAVMLSDRVAEPLLLLDRPRYLTASVGLTLAAAGSDAWTVYNESVIAQRQATADGQVRVTRFEPGMGASARRRIELETDLRRALDENQFRLVYQPLVDIHSARLVSLEALIRWDHPERGAVSPGEFIPFAEETGLIVSIGAWVVDAACAMLRRMLDVRRGDACAAIDINLSPRQFRHAGLVSDIAATIGRHGVDPARLGFEVTETAASLDAEAALEVLGGLRELGVRLALDDFGAGYSSLGLLDRWPVQGLKLDRGLTATVRDARRAAIARAVTTLGRDLGMTITAEGIETREQHLAMAALGCDLGQGYFFARPMSADEVVKAIEGDPCPTFPRSRGAGIPA